MTGAPYLIASVDDLFALDPLARFAALIAGPNFDGYLRAEPIRFDPAHPIYGTSCRVAGCAMHSTQAEWWCTRHGQSRRDALRAGVGEAQWLAAAVPFGSKQADRPTELRLSACHFCPDRDATAGDLCHRHAMLLAHARRRMLAFSEVSWAARQVAFPGAGDCRVEGCPRRAESEPSLCPSHRRAWVVSRRPTGPEMQSWLLRRGGDPDAGAVFLAGLAPLVAAEIRYALWTHTKSAAPARWHPMWLRRLVKSCREGGVQSLLELDPGDPTWTPQAAAVNRIVREMLKDVEPIHRSRGDTRELGYLDTNYWGFASQTGARRLISRGSLSVGFAT